MAGDDDADPTIRGLPDQSERAWRHPSEMNGPVTQTSTAVPSASSLLATSLVGKGLFSVVVVLVAAVASIQLIDNSDLGPTDKPSGPGDDAISDYAPATSVAAVPETLPDITPEPPAAFALRQTVRQGQLFASSDDDTPVASAVVVGDVMVTSASAVGAYTTLWLSGGDKPVAVDVNVIGIDRFADIAVLVSPNAETDPDRPGSLFDDLIALPQFDLDQVESVAVGDPANSMASKNGSVIRLDEPISHYSGHTIYSAIVTSIPFEDHLAGAALTTRRGDFIGVVVNAAGAVVSALPVDDVVRLTKSLLALDDAENPGFALELSTDAFGRAVVDVVDPKGPFAETLVEGDVVVSVNGIRLLSADHLTHIVRQLEPGTSVLFTVDRADVQISARLALDNPHLAINPASNP